AGAVPAAHDRAAEAFLQLDEPGRLQLHLETADGNGRNRCLLQVGLGEIEGIAEDVGAHARELGGVCGRGGEDQYKCGGSEFEAHRGSSPRRIREKVAILTANASEQMVLSPMPVPLDTLLAASPYVRELHERHGEWLAGCGKPHEALPTELAEVAAAGRSAASEEDIGRALRRSKARIALLAAVAEVTGQWTPAQSTAALSDLADAALQAGLDVLMRLAAVRGIMTGDAAAAA